MVTSTHHQKVCEDNTHLDS